VFLVSTNNWLKICAVVHKMYSFLYPCIEITYDMDHPYMICSLMISISMYFLLYHPYILVEIPFFCMMTHHGDRLVMEEYHESILQPYIWDNNDVILMTYSVFESFVYRG